MTIAAAFLTDEGVVFGADSATTLTVGGDFARVYNSAQKVFEIGHNGSSRLAICTWGNGSLGNISHRRAAALLAAATTPSTSVVEAAFAMEKIAADANAVDPSGEQVGYFLGGVDPGTLAPACFALTFGGGAPTRTQLATGDCQFRGMPDFFTRVFFGHDPSLPALLFGELQSRLQGKVADGVDIEALAVETVDATIAKIPSGMAYLLPLRDAIDFVHTYIHLTIKAFKFRLGPPLCGGAIEIGFVSCDRPFRWVCHKPFDSAIFQAEGVL